MPNILGSPSISASTPNLGVYGAAWGIPPVLQENMNQLSRAEESGRKERETMKKGSAPAEQKENLFEGFADLNMFTMKNMDAYVFFFLLPPRVNVDNQPGTACICGARWRHSTMRIIPSNNGQPHLHPRLLLNPSSSSNRRGNYECVPS
jgi:hypothetical protein